MKREDTWGTMGAIAAPVIVPHVKTGVHVLNVLKGTNSLTTAAMNAEVARCLNMEELIASVKSVKRAIT